MAEPKVVFAFRGSVGCTSAVTSPQFVARGITCEHIHAGIVLAFFVRRHAQDAAACDGRSDWIVLIS